MSITGLCCAFSNSLWATDHYQPLRMFSGHLADVTCTRFHPNSNYVVTGSSDRTIRLWDVLNGNCVRIFTGHKVRQATRSVVSHSAECYWAVHQLSHVMIAESKSKRMKLSINSNKTMSATELHRSQLKKNEASQFYIKCTVYTYMCLLEATPP